MTYITHPVDEWAQRAEALRAAQITAAKLRFDNAIRVHSWPGAPAGAVLCGRCKCELSRSMRAWAVGSAWWCNACAVLCRPHGAVPTR